MYRVSVNIIYASEVIVYSGISNAREKLREKSSNVPLKINAMAEQRAAKEMKFEVEFGGTKPTS